MVIRYILALLMASPVSQTQLVAFKSTGVEEIDAVRLSVQETPTKDANALHRQSILFSWFRHMIHLGIDPKSLHEVGFTLAKWGQIQPENYNRDPSPS